MPDTTVTIKLSVKETNLVLNKLRQAAQLIEDVSKLPPEPMSKDDSGNRRGGPAERQKQRQETLELRSIIEKIEN